MTKPKPSRSGAKWTEAQYQASGYRRLALRLPAATLAKLQRFADRHNMARVTVLCDLIEENCK